MNRIIKPISLIVLFVLLSCEKEDSVKFYLNTFNPNKYYQQEIIPADFLQMYGSWELRSVSGGFHGSGYEPDYDYLEVKSIGIYGLIRNDTLFEYGKIELDTFATLSPDLLQVKLVPDNNITQNPRHFPLEYIELNDPDSLNLLTPNPDGYSYHYIRIR